MLRPLLIVHRYLAVATGLLMALWCLSGFVMMYQPYPALTAEERLAGLAPLQLTGCCRTEFLADDGLPVADFRIEMLGSRLVLRQSGVPPVDLVTGTAMPDLQQGDLEALVAGHAARRGLQGNPRSMGRIEIDQWTLQTARRNQPVHLYFLDDAAGTALYVNGGSGEIFQDTNRRERLLNWFGAIPHWLYPTALRRNGALWSKVVIWTSVAGTFLTLTGLYVGISRLRRRRAGGDSASPFQGWWYWHHMAGLFFGALALTWVFSGLLTMNPWGWLVGGDAASRLQPQLIGVPATSELRTFLRQLPTHVASGEFTALRSVPLGGQLFVLAQRADGSSVRLDAHARPAPVTATAAQRVFGNLGGRVASLQLLEEEDAYYYAHKGKVDLPAWRAVLGDAERTRVYVARDTGQVQVVDRPARLARWLTQGLHSLDFAGLRQRPTWDVVTLLLLAGVAALCITGSWMAIQRVRRDLSRS